LGIDPEEAGTGGEWKRKSTVNCRLAQKWGGKKKYRGGLAVLNESDGGQRAHENSGILSGRPTAIRTSKTK